MEGRAVTSKWRVDLEHNDVLRDAQPVLHGGSAGVRVVATQPRNQLRVEVGTDAAEPAGGSVRSL
jgi:hypothetical protein